MAKNNKINHQIKITLTEDNYKKLQQSAEKNYRTLSQEVNYRINQLLSRPGGLDAPLSSPLIYPAGVRTPLHTEPGIPEPPYKITLNTDTFEKPTADIFNNKSKSTSKNFTFTTGEPKSIQNNK